jgi:hypothetical protein
MIRPEHQFDIRPDLRKAASTKAESTTAESVIRPKQLVRVIITFPSLFPLSWLVNWLLTRVTRPVALVEQELPTLPHLMCLPPSFGGILVAYSLVICGVLSIILSSFYPFSFVRCVVCPSIFASDTYLEF